TMSSASSPPQGDTGSPNQPQESWLSHLEFTGLFVTTGTALLYLMGDGIHRGFLQKFGIVHSVIPMSPEELLFIGARGVPAAIAVGTGAMFWYALRVALFSAAAFGVALLLRYLLRKLKILGPPDDAGKTVTPPGQRQSNLVTIAIQLAVAGGIVL